MDTAREEEPEGLPKVQIKDMGGSMNPTPVEISDEVKEAVDKVLNIAAGCLAGNIYVGTSDKLRELASAPVQLLIDAKLKEKEDEIKLMKELLGEIKDANYDIVVEECEQLKQQLLLANDATAKGEAGRNLGTAYEECQKENVELRRQLFSHAEKIGVVI